MKTETIEYKVDNTICKGYVVYPENAKKAPGILVAHAWRGQDNFAREKAKQLAELGYIAFAVDIYGNGISVTNEEAPKMMAPYFLDRALLRKRIVGAYETLRKVETVDPTKIGAIGFCFGGLTVIELLRSGVELRGVVSFHGLLGYSLKENKATPIPSAKKLHGAILILHGHDDPMVSQEDVLGIEKEFTQAAIDWQLHVYGNTSHAFTNPEATNKELGLLYNEKSAKRAWQEMKNFFNETLV